VLEERVVTTRPRSRRSLWLIASGALAAGVYFLWTELCFVDSAQQRVELALAAEAAKDVPEAVRQMQRALELEPGVPMLTQLGHLYARANRYEEAAATYDQALLLEPENMQLLEWTLLANMHLGRTERMRELLDRQLALGPEDPLLHLRRASLAKRLGDPKAAIQHQREALRLGASEAGLRNDVAWTLATSPDAAIRDPDEAIRLAQALVDESATRDPNEIDTLAAAFAAAGRFDEAVAAATEAAALAAERHQTQLAESIRARLELYRARQAYVETASSNGT
jgi:spermidine synthase